MIYIDQDSLGYSRETKGLRKLGQAVAMATALTFGAGFVSSVLAQSCENPDELTFAIIPTEETVAELELYKPVTDRLAKETGKKIQFFMPTSYAAVVEGLLGKFVDVAVLGPYSYVIASDKDDTIEVFATYAKRAGHLQVEGPGYAAALVTKKGSKFTDIDSLEGSVLGLVDPGSTSGNLFRIQRCLQPLLPASWGFCLYLIAMPGIPVRH